MPPHCRLLSRPSCVLLFVSTDMSPYQVKLPPAPATSFGTVFHQTLVFFATFQLHILVRLLPSRSWSCYTTLGKPCAACYRCLAMLLLLSRRYQRAGYTAHRLAA
ncbi:hypothetical protein Cob_v004252 [Colletotrichum orbiculare MAFF 240422]|uniref:Uncharacterized protein n=1 Tax=Colletotrichum orbiculare (strain 104-T / ATCC 96160 / CBS 514.97 / LARS 414 / MAFF 240422) TaxID=1213857 RepID=A0A484FWL3_COLOR|nr:hypothetical protein Cob_v004252 [Colletotrichum orbiculare MAFF 240422]